MEQGPSEIERPFPFLSCLGQAEAVIAATQPRLEVGLGGARAEGVGDEALVGGEWGSERMKPLGIRRPLEIADSARGRGRASRAGRSP